MRTAIFLLASFATLLTLASESWADQTAWSQSHSSSGRAWRAAATQGSVYRLVANDNSDAADGPQPQTKVKLSIPQRNYTPQPGIRFPSIPPRVRYVQPLPQSRMSNSGPRVLHVRPTKPKVVKVRSNVAPQSTTPLRANKPPGFGLTDDGDENDESIGDDTYDAMQNTSEPDQDSLFEDEASADDSDIDDIKFPEDENESADDESATPETKPDADSKSTPDSDPSPMSDPPPTEDPKPSPDPKDSDPKPDSDSPHDGDSLGNVDPDTADEATDSPKDPKPPQKHVELSIPDKKPDGRPANKYDPNSDSDWVKSQWDKGNNRPQDPSTDRQPLPPIPQPQKNEPFNPLGPDRSGLESGDISVDKVPQNSDPSRNPKPTYNPETGKFEKPPSTTAGGLIVHDPLGDKPRNDEKPKEPTSGDKAYQNALDEANESPGLELTDDEIINDPNPHYRDDESIGDDTMEATSHPAEPDQDSLFEDGAGCNDADIDDIEFPEDKNNSSAEESSTPVTKSAGGQNSTPASDPTPMSDPPPADDPEPMPDPPEDPQPSPDSSPPPDDKPLGNPDPDTGPTTPPPAPKPPQKPVKLTIPDKKTEPKTPRPRNPNSDFPPPDYDDPPGGKPPRPGRDNPRGPRTDDGSSPDNGSPGSGGGKTPPPKNPPPPKNTDPTPPSDDPGQDSDDPGSSDGNDFPGVGSDDPRSLEDLIRDGNDAFEDGDFPDNTPQEVKDRLGEEFPKPKTDRERAADTLIDIGKGAVDAVVDDVIDKGLEKLGIPTLPTPAGVVTGVLGDAETTNNGHPTDKAEIEMRNSWEEANKIKREMEELDNDSPELEYPEEVRDERRQELQKQLDEAEAKSKQAEEEYLETVKWRYEEMSKERPQTQDPKTTPAPSTKKSNTENPRGPASEGKKNKLLN